MTNDPYIFGYKVGPSNWFGYIVKVLKAHLIYEYAGYLVNVNRA